MDVPARRAAWPGLSVEHVRLHPGGPVDFAYEGPRLILRLGESGRRTDGETFLVDGGRSTARAMAGLLHLVPPGARLWGWSRPAAGGGGWGLARIELDTGALLSGEDAAAALAARLAALRPRLAFREAGLAATARKLAALAAAAGSAPVALHAATLGRLLALEVAALDSGGRRPAGEGGGHRGGLAPAALRRACGAMLDRLGEDPSLAEIAAAAGLSPWHFCREFRRSTGLPPHRWMFERRMERAAALLGGTATPVTEVALEVGFGGPSQFAAAFRRHTGLSPTAYRAACARA